MNSRLIEFPAPFAYQTISLITAWRLLPVGDELAARLHGGPGIAET